MFGRSKKGIQSRMTLSLSSGYPFLASNLVVEQRTGKYVDVDGGMIKSEGGNSGVGDTESRRGTWKQ